MKFQPDLEIGLAHARGAALGAVLCSLQSHTIALMVARIKRCSGRQGAATANRRVENAGAARSRQLHAGHNARSTRYGLKGAYQEIHGSRG